MYNIIQIINKSQMEINIKVKFLDEIQKNSTDINNVEFNESTSLKNFIENQKKQLLFNNQQIKHYYGDNDDLDNQILDLKSFRQSQEKSTIYNRKIPKQVITHRYSKSKQIRKVSKGKNVVELQSKTSLYKRKKQSKNLISKNPSCLKKSSIINSSKKQTLVASKTNIIHDTFTEKYRGLEGKKVLKQFSEFLNQREKIQIINQKQIYYIGAKNKSNLNEDDVQGNYIWQKHDHIGFRYELLQRLGSGTFGEVVKALDHKNNDLVAIKIIKSKKQYLQLALNQINILMIIKQKDSSSEKNCVKIKDFLVFRNHMCLIFQILSISLYELLKMNQFEGIRMDFIRRFAIQIFNGLAFLKKNKIIHSDIKPQNILLKSKTKTGIKLIDFGTSVFVNDTNYGYIQSRYYRAPEVILGRTYDCAIDMWSAGCVLAQLYIGMPLFSGDNQQQQLSLIFQAIGLPTKQYLKDCEKSFNFFYSNLTPKIIKTKQGKVLLPQTKPLSKRIFDKQFLDFLLKIFRWKEQERLTPLEALMHPWILEGLPKQIKEQHLIYIKQELKYQQIIIKPKKESQILRKSNEKKKHVKRNSQLFSDKKPVEKHMRRRSDSIY